MGTYMVADFSPVELSLRACADVMAVDEMEFDMLEPSRIPKVDVGKFISGILGGTVSDEMGLSNPRGN